MSSTRESWEPRACQAAPSVFCGPAPPGEEKGAGPPVRGLGLQLEARPGRLCRHRTEVSQVNRAMGPGRDWEIPEDCTLPATPTDSQSCFLPFDPYFLDATCEPGPVLSVRATARM